METRRRGHSFYEDEEESDDVIQVRVKSASPSPEGRKVTPARAEESRDVNDTDQQNLPRFVSTIDSSDDPDEDGSSRAPDPYSADSSFDNVSATAEEEEEDPQPRGRSRSRSMCKQLVDPTNLPVTSSSSDGGHLGDSPGSGDSDSSDEDRVRSKSADRCGSLTEHELQVLKRGLEDATKIPNRDELQEEEEEKRAAKAEEEERRVLAGKYGPGKLSSSGDDKPPQAGSLSSSSVRNFFSRDKGAARSTSTDSGSGNNAESIEAQRQASHDGPPSSSAGFKPSSPTVMQKYTLGSENNNMRRFKILLLGDSGVGKSSLILRWTEDRYLATLTGTVGVNFKSKKVNIDGEAVHIQVWDTAGQQQFHKITTSYYRGAHGIMVVYDVSDPESLANVEYWIKNIKTHATASVRVVLVGNKTDLRAKWLKQEAADKAQAAAASSDEKDIAEEAEAEADEDDVSHKALAAPAACTDYGAGREIADKFQIPYFETSALDASGTDNAFMNIARFCVGVEDGNKSLLVPSGEAGHLPEGANAAAKPSMISRMMGRSTAAPPKAAPTPPPRAKAMPMPVSGVAGKGKGKDKDKAGQEKKKCTMQ